MTLSVCLSSGMQSAAPAPSLIEPKGLASGSIHNLPDTKFDASEAQITAAPAKLAVNHEVFYLSNSVGCNRQACLASCVAGSQ